MHRTLSTLSLLLLGVLSWDGQAAAVNLGKFTGLWQGIDAKDGSLETLTITRNSDRTLNLLVNDTYWGRCQGGRGLGQGTGVPIARNSVRFDDYAVKCFESGSVVISYPSTIILGSDGALIRTLAPPFSPIVYYRSNAK
jgi:hypothetical protein